MSKTVMDTDQDLTAGTQGEGEVFLRVGELNRYEVEWSDSLRVSPRGGMVYFGHFLSANKQFDELVEHCPLSYTSPNAPSKRQVLGTLVCGLLEGAFRYAHLSHIKGDHLSAQALGIEGGFVSEDSVRRGLKKGTEEDWCAWERWMFEAEISAVLPVLTERYILDLDTSVKPVYGRQEGAEISYNPKKPGRPSQSLHVGFIGSLRLLFHVDVRGGKQHAACHMAAGIWARIDALPIGCRPYLIRGDIGFGNEGYMNECERRGLWYLFKLKLTSKVENLILKLMGQTVQAWQDAPETGCQYICAKIQLTGWSCERNVIVLRRPTSASRKGESAQQPNLPNLDLGDAKPNWEHAVLVHHSELPVATIPQLYRDRADCENVLDELKNQWGLGGFSTRDLKRVVILARLCALVCNWWNVFARIAQPARHMEPLTSRPELLRLMTQVVTHAGKKVIRCTSHHENTHQVKRAFTRLHRVFSWVESIAGQLSGMQIWAVQLSIAFYGWLRGKVLNVPDCVQEGIRKLAPAFLGASP